MLVIDSEGSKIGVMNIREAIRNAQDQGMDLLLVSSSASPPVCRVLDFGKFRYEEKKRNSDQKHHEQKLKEVKISPHTHEHDLNVTLNKVNKFLNQGDKVKVTCVFKQRELAHPELGLNKIQYILNKISCVYHVEKTPVVEKNMHTILSPTKK